jgi:hypothetical protein
MIIYGIIFIIHYIIFICNFILSVYVKEEHISKIICYITCSLLFVILFCQYMLKKNIYRKLFVILLVHYYL